jgi:hypothetical protein
MNQMIFSTTESEDPLTQRAEKCQHNQVREIGEDFDKDGRMLRLVRCTRCGLLMRTYLPYI